jgi:nitrogen regulatory protein P-II 1
MDHLLIMVLDDSEQLNDVLAAWRDAGIKGITIFESTGLNRVLPRHTAQPMYAGFSQVFGGGRIGHHTLLAMIDSLELAEKAVAATEDILGDLTQPHTGIIWAVPVAKVWGVPEPYGDELE